MTQINSKKRLLRTLRHLPTDYLPCSFMSFTALRRRCGENLFELVKAERGLGLDSFLFIPSAPRPERLDHPDLRGLPARFGPSVTTKEWREESPGTPGILHKEYSTPAGKLRASVRLADDWPHGEHIPFVDDYQVSHGLKPLITEARELEALCFLLTHPSPEDVARFSEEARKARAFAEEQGVLLAGGWGVGGDMAGWLCGLSSYTLLPLDQPQFITALLEMIHAWNVARMKVVLSSPVDLYVRRAWYEGCDFLMPRFFREVMLPRLKAEVALAHEHGALFGYICSSGTVPMLDFYLEAGVDVLIGIDPIQGTHTDLPLMKQKAGAKLALWGGVSGAVTVEMGSEDEVRAAVARAIETLGPSGFVLSPVDNITVDAPQTWRNVEAFLDEWRQRR